ncbi:hypothetical protein BTHE68_03010 [Burkholderia sp. THE68]|nr:hypothetical protein BTHE68_03010 [Burkholderia sp. THE68]
MGAAFKRMRAALRAGIRASGDGTAPVRDRMRMVRRAFARFTRPLECAFAEQAPLAHELHGTEMARRLRLARGDAQLQSLR